MGKYLICGGHVIDKEGQEIVDLLTAAIDQVKHSDQGTFSLIFNIRAKDPAGDQPREPLEKCGRACEGSNYCARYDEKAGKSFKANVEGGCNYFYYKPYPASVGLTAPKEKGEKIC